MTLRGTFRQPFPEQVAAFRVRLGNLVPTQAWDDIRRSQHDRAFMVAGAMKADLLADLARAVDRAIAEGASLEEFRRDFRDIVERNGWHGWTGEGTKAGEAWRTRVIYRTNARVSYAAGRHAQLRKFPFWIYRHGGSAEPRLHHLAWDGLVLPSDHEFWDIAYPPNGWGCSCYVVGARSRARAAGRGGDLSKELQPGWDALQPRSGTPKGIGKGWDYAPGATTSETVAQMADKAVDWPEQLASAFFRDLPAAQADALAQAYRRLPSLHDKLRRYAQTTIGATAASMRERADQPTLVSLGTLTQTQRRWLDADPGARPMEWRVFGRDLRTQANNGDMVIDPEDWAQLVEMLDAPDVTVAPGPAGTSTIELRRQVGTRVLVAVFARVGMGLNLVSVRFEAVR